MEFLRVAEGKLSPKRELRSSKSRNQRSKLMKNNLMESIDGGETHVLSQTSKDGVVRMKLLVKKEELKQMLEMVRGGRSCNNSNGGSYQQSPPPSSFSLEHRLNQLRRRQLLRGYSAGKARRGSSWSPVLQSIPEEISA